MSHSVSPSSEERFSDRVENYVRYRPGYPQEIVEMLREETGLTAGSVIADVGSGTGISAELFLRAGCVVHGVEPNPAMREAAERLLSHYPDFRSVDGKAQATTLADDCMDFVVAAQAFHWFDVPETRTEFSRILKPDGKVILIWNERLLDATRFLIDYEQLLLTYGTDYQAIRHEKTDEERMRLFFLGNFMTREFSNTQSFDFESLKGRLLSSSYAPAEGRPQHEPMMAGLRAIFDRHQQDGRVGIDYRTMVYVGS
ncbi:MAG: class I SAM-dependent methyltransferase [Luteolibacter sp.]